MRSDCSTGLVLDVLAASGTAAGAAAAPWLAKPCCSVNHFDADAVLSMWTYINREAALQHSAGKLEFCRGQQGQARLACEMPPAVTWCERATCPAATVLQCCGAPPASATCARCP